MFFKYFLKDIKMYNKLARNNSLAFIKYRVQKIIYKVLNTKNYISQLKEEPQNGALRNLHLIRNLFECNLLRFIIPWNANLCMRRGLSC